MIGARVDVRAGWGADIAREINEQVRHAVADASQHGAKVAAAGASRRRRTGRMADIQPVDVIGTPDGWEGGFRSPAFYAPFQSFGTLGSRRRKLKASTIRRRQSGSGQARLARTGGSGGITPLRFLEQGRTEGRRRLLDLLNNL